VDPDADPASKINADQCGFRFRILVFITIGLILSIEKFRKEVEVLVVNQHLKHETAGKKGGWGCNSPLPSVLFESWFPFRCIMTTFTLVFSSGLYCYLSIGVH
jgi:hypothetical protein